MKKAIITAALTAVSLIALSSAAAAAPPEDVFQNNDEAWLCSGEPDAPVPPQHCLNKNSNGKVIHIMVFDGRVTESISFDPKFDDRPCPQDEFSDGTWYTPPDEVDFWVCHHKP